MLTASVLSMYRGECARLERRSLRDPRDVHCTLQEREQGRERKTEIERRRETGSETICSSLLFCVVIRI